MGTLYIIATSIGNLKDITLRALETLKEVDFILCEDTRQTAKLLNHYNISKPLISYFQHSKLSKIEYIIDLLSQGKNLALVTDAGTPGISDPGGKLVDKLISLKGDNKNNLQAYKLKNFKTKIIPIPGACAATAALSISGFPTDKFIFMGFPPHKKGREKFFKEISEAKYTVVFYESVHRILKTLEQLLVSLRGTKSDLVTKQSRYFAADNEIAAPASGRARNDERQIVVCRELTKQFETIYRGNASDVLNQIKNDTIKGEFVVIVGMKE